MCTSDKYGRPSMSCMIPLALMCIILGGGLIGTWVGCYYECDLGKNVEYNYYAAIWTGGLAIFSGLLQLLLLCFWNKILKYIIVILNVILVLCCLLSGALYSYVTYREVTMSTAQASDVPTLGMILSGLQAVLAIFIMCFIMMWNCVLACTNVDPQPKIYNRDGAPRGQSSQSRAYEDDFFNHEPSIYQAQGQYQNRPQEVSYGQSDQSNTGTASRYIIPRASVRGAVKDDGYQGNGYQSNGGTMVVDGRPTSGYGVFNGEPGGFYSGSTRYQHSMDRRNGAAPQNGGTQQNGGFVQNGGTMQNGGAMQNGTGGRSRQHGSHTSNGQVGYDRYGQGVSLLQMHGVAPTHNISDGYY